MGGFISTALTRRSPSSSCKNKKTETRLSAGLLVDTQNQVANCGTQVAPDWMLTHLNSPIASSDALIVVDKP